MTEHKQAEEALRESEERFRATFEQAAVGIAHNAPDGKWLGVNQKFCEIVGYDREELLEKTFRDITHPNDLQADLDYRRRLLVGEIGTYSVEKRYLRKDGSIVWAELAMSLVREPSGEPGYFITVIEDVTERKRVEETVRRQADLLEQTHDAVFMWELGGEITYWNRGAERLYGWFKEEAIGHITHELLKTVHPFPLEELDRKLQRDGYWEGELIHHARDGREVVVESRHVLTRYGVAVGQGLVMETNQDVTERKRAEEALRDIRQIERRRLARDLHDEVLQDLVYALQAMRETRRKAAAPELEAELEREVGGLERAIAGLRGAIHDLRLEGDREHTLAEMLESAVELSRQRSPESEIELSIKEEGSLPLLPREQEVELLRIVQEALANARRHSGASRVRVTEGVSDGMLWAEISDDGRGFDPGSAIGMGTVGMRERAKALGGDLKIRSEPGAGTTVRFELPLERNGEEPEEEARVLLLDDHASLRQAVASVFERKPGFVVVGQAGTLAEARGMLESLHEEVDVAIVDLALPDGYGWELIKELRKVTPQAMALVLSASLDRYEIARAVEAGAAGVLHKSADMDEIVETVRRLRKGESLLPLEEVVELLRLAGSRKEQEYEARQAIAQLTPREKEVLRALAEGLDSREIAKRLYISVETERNHVTNILAKLGVHSRLQALVFALRHGLVEMDR